MEKALANNLVGLIDIVATRGAFKGEELQGVGILRAALVEIVNTPDEAEKPDETVYTGVDL